MRVSPGKYFERKIILVCIFGYKFLDIAPVFIIRHQQFLDYPAHLACAGKRKFPNRFIYLQLILKTFIHNLQIAFTIAQFFIIKWC